MSATIEEAWNGSGDTLGCPGRVRGPQRGPGRVGGPFRRVGMGRGTLG